VPSPSCPPALGSAKGSSVIELDDLNWREFERLIAGMLETDGYRVELTQGSKDWGR
jgi:HJR/Mrr/RecB family endonuclease